MTPQDTAAMLAHLGKAGLHFPPQVDEHLAGTWYSQLRGINADHGLEAVGRWIASNADWPSCADLIRLAKVIEREQRQKALPRQGAGYRCKCLDVGMVEVEGQRDAWRPCQSCNPDAYSRWSMGDYATKVFRPVLDPIDVDGARVELAGVREVLAQAQKPNRRRVA